MLHISTLYLALLAVHPLSLCEPGAETRGQDLENTFRAFQNHWFWAKKTKVLEVHSMSLPQNASKGGDSPVDTPMGTGKGAM